MSERTIIFDGSNPQSEHAEQTRIISDRKFKAEIHEKVQHQQKTFHTLKKVGLVVGGIGAGIALMGFMPSMPIDETAPIPIPEEPQSATTVTDDMSYQEAFDAARQELGAGHYFSWNGNTYTTYTQEEWARLDEDDKAEYQTYLDNQIANHSADSSVVNDNISQAPFVVHDQAPVATTITDDMSFDDAFAVARQEVGPGGVFEWHGKLYNTYYGNEWDNMDASEREQFAQSVELNDLDSNNVTPSHIENLPEAIVVSDPSSEHFLTDEYITLETGETVHIGYFQQGEEVVVKLDVDGDNSYEYIVDSQEGNLVGLNGNPDIALSSLDSSTPDADALPTPVMSEYVNVDGYNALVTIFSDGTQQAQVDLDGDGMHDTTLTLDTSTGEMSAYDVNGNLIAQEDVFEYNQGESPELIFTGGEYTDDSDYVDGFGEDRSDGSDFMADDNYEDGYADGSDFMADNDYTDNFGEDFNHQADVSDWV